MTVSDLVRALRRRWYVVLVGVLVTMAGGYHLVSNRGEYVSAVGIYFFRPPSVNNANRYLSDDDVVSVTEVVGVAANSSAARAELRKAGVEGHYTLEIFNAGNQFVVIHDRALLDLSVRGSSEAAVRRTMALVIDRVDIELRRTQTEAGADPKTWVVTQNTPSDPVVFQGRGSGMRAMAGILILGGALTTTAAVLVDDLARRRTARRRDEPREMAPV